LATRSGQRTLLSPAGHYLTLSQNVRQCCRMVVPSAPQRSRSVRLGVLRIVAVVVVAVVRREDHVGLLDHDMRRRIRVENAMARLGGRGVCGRPLSLRLASDSHTRMLRYRSLRLGMDLLPRNFIKGWRCCQSALVARMSPRPWFVRLVAIAQSLSRSTEGKELARGAIPR